MKKTYTLLACGVFIAAAVFGKTNTPADPNEQVAKELTKRLRTLADYGVYDHLSFQVDDGKVVLRGSTHTPSLEAAALKAAKAVAGVNEVQDEIEVLPLSRMDERLRTDVFFRLYSSNALSRYAAGGGLLARDPFLRPPLGWANTPVGSWQPAGDYAIHIIVKNGQLSLEGVVGNQGDKDIAGLLASATPGLFGVTNNLVVAR